jgi:hypothetical protein
MMIEKHTNLREWAFVPIPPTFSTPYPLRAMVPVVACRYPPVLTKKVVEVGETGV